MGSCYSKGETGRPSGAAAAAAAAASSSSPPKPNKNNNDRMFMNGATKFASLHTQQGNKGTNQDAMLVWENFSSRKDTILCGVFDGHGPYGHMVAHKLRDSLPLLISTQLKDTDDDDECFHSQLKHSILQASQLMDNELKLQHSTIDCFCSGSTAVILINQGHDIVIANVGDSRAVLATRDNKDNSLLPIQLTIDLKPDLPKEAARIQQFNGRVFALQDEPEVARLWLPNNDSPGLAMARAFGDFCLKDFGLISTPDIFYHSLQQTDQFIILATDGVWDVLSNKEAVDIVASAPSHATAARALVDCATRAWRLKYPTSKNDDCAVVCLFLDRLRGQHPQEENGTPPSKNEIVVNAYGHEIVPVEEATKVESLSENCPDKRRSLAECISVADDDDEWSALEGISRVNSLLSLPRFLSGEKRSGGSWRKWL